MADLKIRKVKHFHTEGIAKDQEAILRIRWELESRLVEDMRARGYVPVLDITPELFWDYITKDQNFKYVVIVYGTYVGKRQAQKIMGLLGPHQIMFEPYVENLGNDSEPD